MDNWSNPAKALQQIINKDSRAASRLAKTVGRSRASVYFWASGQTVPSPTVRVALEAATGIPAWHWLSEAERLALSKAS
jgi:hypothetical protein